MSKLEKLKGILLKEKAENVGFSINCPAQWSGVKNQKEDAYTYFINAISEILESSNPDADHSAPFYSRSSVKNGSWIKDASIYSMMPRFAASSYFINDEKIKKDKLPFKNTGTFLKAICMLKMLKRMGIDTIYLLPVMKISTRNIKGEAGSCYSIKNFMEIDGSLKDPISGNSSSADLEFAAFVEACHILQLKVLIDIIPRTASIDSELMIDHPDFFYWIKREELENYKAPRVPRLRICRACDAKNIHTVFNSKEVIEHISKFQPDPMSIDKKKFERIREEYKKNPNGDFLGMIEAEFGITVAPAFSDCINDTQPPWSDVTYLRLYKDHPELSKKFLREKNIDPNPYILYDVAKASNVPGSVPNRELWNHLSNVLPEWQRRYGIDGARIDMGHAIPADLLKEIMDAARANNPAFCFIAEELNNKRALLSKKLGYDTIVGDAFATFARLEEGGFDRFIESAKTSPIPILCSPETHDTPRIASKNGGKLRASLLSSLSLFIPNAIPFINNCQEIFEIAPMNLGIGAVPEDQFILPKDDPNYGKLALFDFVIANWNNTVESNFVGDLEKLNEIKSAYVKNDESVFSHLDLKTEGVFGSVYTSKAASILIVANLDTQNKKNVKFDLKKLINVKDGEKTDFKVNVLYSNYSENTGTDASPLGFSYNEKSAELEVNLRILEFAILELKQG